MRPVILASTSPYSVEALTPVSLCRFDRNGLWNLYRNHPDLGYDITWITA